MSDQRINQPAPPALLPTSGAAAGIANTIRGRRTGLVEHGVDSGHDAGISVCGVGLAAMQEAANGSTPHVRTGRKVRYRLAQLAGQEALPLEDVTAIGAESQFGRDVAVAGLTAILSCWGFDVVPLDATHSSQALLLQAGKVARMSGDLVDTITEAEADGVVTAQEGSGIEKKARYLAQELQITARVAAHRVAKEGSR